jgi:hypothetical protein
MIRSVAEPHISVQMSREWTRRYENQHRLIEANDEVVADQAADIGPTGVVGHPTMEPIRTVMRFIVAVFFCHCGLLPI